MGAGVVDGIAGASHVEEGDPLVAGGDQFALSGLQPIGVCNFDIRAMRSSLWAQCRWPANPRHHAPARLPVGEPKTTGARTWCTATQLRIFEGSSTALAGIWSEQSRRVPTFGTRIWPDVSDRAFHAFAPFRRSAATRRGRLPSSPNVHATSLWQGPGHRAVERRVRTNR